MSRYYGPSSRSASKTWGKATYVNPNFNCPGWIPIKFKEPIKESPKQESVKESPKQESVKESPKHEIATTNQKKLEIKMKNGKQIFNLHSSCFSKAESDKLLSIVNNNTMVQAKQITINKITEKFNSNSVTTDIKLQDELYSLLYNLITNCFTKDEYNGIQDKHNNIIDMLQFVIDKYPFGFIHSEYLDLIRQFVEKYVNDGYTFVIGSAKERHNNICTWFDFVMIILGKDVRPETVQKNYSLSIKVKAANKLKPKLDYAANKTDWHTETVCILINHLAPLLHQIKQTIINDDVIQNGEIDFIGDLKFVSDHVDEIPSEQLKNDLIDLITDFNRLSMFVYYDKSVVRTWYDLSVKLSTIPFNPLIELNGLPQHITKQIIDFGKFIDISATADNIYETLQSIIEFHFEIEKICKLVVEQNPSNNPESMPNIKFVIFQSVSLLNYLIKMTKIGVMQNNFISTIDDCELFAEENLPEEYKSTQYVDWLLLRTEYVKALLTPHCNAKQQAILTKISKFSEETKELYGKSCKEIVNNHAAEVIKTLSNNTTNLKFQSIIIKRLIDYDDYMCYCILLQAKEQLLKFFREMHIFNAISDVHIEDEKHRQIYQNFMVHVTNAVINNKSINMIRTSTDVYNSFSPKNMDDINDNPIEDVFAPLLYIENIPTAPFIKDKWNISISESDEIQEIKININTVEKLRSTLLNIQSSIETYRSPDKFKKEDYESEACLMDLFQTELNSIPSKYLPAGTPKFKLFVGLKLIENLGEDVMPALKTALRRNPEAMRRSYENTKEKVTVLKNIITGIESIIYIIDNIDYIKSIVSENETSIWDIVTDETIHDMFVNDCPKQLKAKINQLLKTKALLEHKLKLFSQCMFSKLYILQAINNPLLNPNLEIICALLENHMAKLVNNDIKPHKFIPIINPSKPINGLFTQPGLDDYMNDLGQNFVANNSYDSDTIKALQSFNMKFLL